MSTSLNVCPYCRDKCPLCHQTPKHSHPIRVCRDCKKQFLGKCCVCGGKNWGPGTAGATGPGKVCDGCCKRSDCTFCKTKL